MKERAFFSAAELARDPVPQRRWIVKDLIPDRNVTVLSGDGGTGKTCAAMQLGVAVATEGRWLSLGAAGGGVLYLSGEEERDEMHRRLQDICAAQKTSLGDLHDFHVWDLASTGDAILAKQDGSGIMQPTERWRELHALVTKHRPKLLVVDTLADVFAGDEILRLQSRGFIGMCRTLAIEFDLAVLLLAHPSIAGIKSGKGTSGSTGWWNSVRSYLYLERVNGAPNDRTLTLLKANYAQEGAQLRLRWAKGALWRIGAETLAAKAADEQSGADAKFLELLRLHIDQGRDVSDKPSRSYAPRTFANHPGAGGIKSNAFTAAMERLLTARAIVVENFGPPSKRRSRIVFGAKGNGIDASNGLPTAI